MSKMTYEKPALISLIDRDQAAFGKCRNGSVNVSSDCGSGGTALSGPCKVGSSANQKCTVGVAAGSDCKNGGSARKCKSGGGK